MSAQTADASLKKCFDALQNQVDSKSGQYLIMKGILVRKWYPQTEGQSEWNTVYQIVFPKDYHF